MEQIDCGNIEAWNHQAYLKHEMGVQIPKKIIFRFFMFVLDFIVIVVAGGLSFLPLLESVIWVP